MARLPLATAFLALLSAPTSSGQTWVIDDDGGPGVDFTDLPEAVASPLFTEGDVLLVQPGTYTLVAAPSLTVLGQGEQPEDVWIHASMGANVLSNIADRTYFANVRFSGLYVRDCPGLVVLCDVRTNDLHVEDAADLRMLGQDSRRVGIERSNVELSESDLSSTLWVSSNEVSHVRIARTAIVGKHGGQLGYWGDVGEDGSPAVDASDGADVWLMGDRFTLRGGNGGLGDYCHQDGKGGPALELSDSTASVRLSGYELVGGFIPDLNCTEESGQTEPTSVIAGSLIEPDDPDPTLQVQGKVTPGAAVRLVTRAYHAEKALLFGGFQHVALNLPDVVGRLSVVPEIVLASETIGDSGIASFKLEIPATAAKGTLFHVQALATYAGEESLRLTNPLPLLVR